jgi:hypothetical protein
VAGLLLALRRPRLLLPLLPAGVALVLPLLLSPPLSRYRVVCAMTLMPVAGLALARGVGWLRERRLAEAFGLGAGILVLGLAAQVAERIVVFGGRPPGTVRYRSQEFWLGTRFHIDGGRLGAAAEQARMLARHNPDPVVRSSALSLLADLELQRGRPSAAREALEEAAALRADDPTFLIGVGDRYLAVLRDTTSAAVLYRRALLAGPDASTRAVIEQRLAQVGDAGP